LASYQIDIANAAGVFTPTARRGGTPASGGTEIPLGWIENNNSGSNTTTSLLNVGAFAAYRGIRNDYSLNGGTPTYQITLTDNGTGVFTPVLRKNGTPSAGGAVVPINWVENNNGGAPNTSSTLLSTAFISALDAILNDRSLNP
jgi:hypothetical protein